MNEKITNEMTEELYATISKLQTAEDCKNFLTDLCSVNEIMKMAQRIWAAKLLKKGCTYQQVIAETDISSTTLSRVSNALRRGAGGYTKFIDSSESV